MGHLYVGTLIGRVIVISPRNRVRIVQESKDALATVGKV